MRSSQTKIWLLRSVRRPTVRTPTACKPMPNVRLFWRESVWPPESCKAEIIKESIKTKTGEENVSVSVLSKVLSFD